MAGVLPIKTPELAGFAPLASANALFFMTMQGGMMALNFGAYYTVGKRMISAMTNKQFNQALSHPESFKQFIDQHQEVILTQFEESIKKSNDRVQDIILKESYRLEEFKLIENIKLFKWFLRVASEEGIELLDAAGNRIQSGLDESDSLLQKGKTLQQRFDEAKAKADAARDPIAQKREDEARQIEKDKQKVRDEAERLRNVEEREKINQNISKRFTLKFTAPSGLVDFQETHTQTEWDKIIKYWHGQVLRNKAARTSYTYLFWKNLQNAYRFNYNMWPRNI